MKRSVNTVLVSKMTDKQYRSVFGTSKKKAQADRAVEVARQIAFLENCQSGSALGENLQSRLADLRDAE